MRRKSKGHIIIWKVNIVHCSFSNLPSPSALPENFAISSTGSLVVLGGGQLFSGTSSHTLRPLLEALGLPIQGGEGEQHLWGHIHYSHGWNFSQPKPEPPLSQALLLPRSAAESGKEQ